MAEECTHVDQIEPGTNEHVLVLDGGDRLRCRALLLAMGVSWRWA